MNNQYHHIPLVLSLFVGVTKGNKVSNNILTKPTGKRIAVMYYHAKRQKCISMKCAQHFVFSQIDNNIVVPLLVCFTR